MHRERRKPLDSDSRTLMQGMHGLWCAPLYEPGKGAVQARNNEERRRKVEEKGVASETGREEKLLNDETIRAVKRLDRPPTNGRTSSMATSSVTKRETAISLNTPRFFFSLSTFSHDPPPLPPSPPFPSIPQLQGPMYLSLGKQKYKGTRTNTDTLQSSLVGYLLISPTAPLDYTGDRVHTCHPTQSADEHPGTRA